ncbi:MAG: Hsp70 family protein [Clostridiales bacterium]|jgi:molecular chaperone DnaK|nr:Hsp70 family protein [Clostridiales bacterium]
MKWEDCKKDIDRRGSLPEDWFVLGIDLGTTNSVVSYYSPSSGAPETIDVSDGFGKIPLPSVVQWRDGGEWVVGEEAYRSIKLYPDSTVRSAKRYMGTDKTFRLGGKDYAPEEISAKILEELASRARAINPKAEIAGLVVSVPYGFDDAAKKATIRACELAGLGGGLICLIEEPKAAALAMNFKRELEDGERVLVFDFGGGTLDITVFSVTEEPPGLTRLTVISEGGDAAHGGDALDAILTEQCYDWIEAKTGQTRESIVPENRAEVEIRAREAKERLSGAKSFRVPFTFMIPPFIENLTRERYEGLAAAFIEKTRQLTQKALRGAYKGALAPGDISRVLLEGGSSAAPWVRDMLNGVFGDESKIYQSERPALDISVGAAYYAAMKMGLLAGREFSAERRAVAFSGSVPHDIGLEVTNGAKKVFYTLIRRGTPYALARKDAVFTLSGSRPEDMTRFDLRVLERINRDDPVEDCRLIGDIEVTGLPPRPSGGTRLRITLSAAEEGGVVSGMVEDAGGGYKRNFTPQRGKKTRV